MTRFLAHWATTAIALGVAVWIVPGVRAASVPSLLVAALVLGFINAVVRPILVILTLPITILTLGLFYFVINGAAFALTSIVVPGFSVDTVWSAIFGALVVSLFSWFVGVVVGPPRRHRHGD
jgi:putative membrane protein